MVERTNLVLANRSDSLRTTIPASIVRQFGLHAGDKIEWNLKAEGNAMKITITPTKKTRLA